MRRKSRRDRSKTIDIKATRSIDKKSHFSVIVIVIMAVIAIFFIELGLTAEKNEKPIYQYKVEKKSDYGVLLKQNDFYQEKVLPSGLYYASKSIDSFIINFEYKFKAKDKIDIKYYYNITADLVGTVKDEYQDKEIWSKSFRLLKNKVDKQIDTDEFLITEKIDIDYDKYNNLVDLYEQEYGVKLNANLKVRFNICYKTNLLKYGINTKDIDDFIELNIPITNTVTEVSENYEKENMVNIKPPIEEIKIKEYIYYTIAGLCMFACFILTIYKVNRNKMTPQEKYERDINRILKYYRDIIVTVNNEPNVADLKMLELSILDDLIDVAQQNNCNIIYYEDLKNRINYFYVIVGEYAYYHKIVIDD